jgi:hypothetical protein
LSSIDYQIDRGRRRATIRFIGDVDGRLFRSAMAALWRDVPELATYDSICDMLTFTGDISFDDIRSISAAWRLFSGTRDRGCRTATVTTDRYAPVYINVIAMWFRGRGLAVFETLAEADQWLDGGG